MNWTVFWHGGFYRPIPYCVIRKLGYLQKYGYFPLKLCSKLWTLNISPWHIDRRTCHQHLLLLHPFNGLFSRTTWVSQYRKGKTNLDLNEARDDGVLGRQWHQLDHYANYLHLAPDRQPHQHLTIQFFTSRTLFLMPNQQCQSTKGTN